MLTTTISLCLRSDHSDERLHRKIYRNNGQKLFCQEQIPIIEPLDSYRWSIGNVKKKEKGKKKIKREKFFVSMVKKCFNQTKSRINKIPDIRTNSKQ